MPKASEQSVNVNDASKKHLARNIPTDFAGYCRQIAKRDFPHGFSKRGRNNNLLVRRHRSLLEICGLSDNADQVQLQEASEELYLVAVRSEALLISVDRTVSPKPVHEKLRRLVRELRNSVESLDDQTRDAVVCEMGGYESIDELSTDKQAFDDSTSLAEKVSITRKILQNSLDQISYIADHFHYKNSHSAQGKPAAYSFAYTVFALADIFERFDTDQRKATVNQKSTGDSEWAGNFTYSGPFLEFTEAFLLIHNPQQIEAHIATGFASAVRRLTQKYKKKPVLHKFLHGEAKAQDVLDFMIGVDDLR